jgi:hypothetical protein
MRRDCVPEPSNNIDYSLGKKVRKGKKIKNMRHSASSCFKTLTAGGGDGNKTSTCINAHFTGKTNPTPLMRRDCVPEPSNNIDYSLGKKVRKGKNMRHRNVSPVLLVE